MEVIQTGSINTIQVNCQNEEHVNCLSLLFYELLIMKILLLGANGQLGIELQKVLPKLGEMVTLTRNELDLSNLVALHQILELIRPNVIVNASAYTAVDKAETEKDLAMLINANVPELLAKYSAENGALLVHYSTDYVFDGKKSTPYLESDLIYPISIYGSSKAKGEEFISLNNCKHLIFRTSWLFSYYGQNFFTKILNLAKEKEELFIVDDQWGTPTSCNWLADVTFKTLIHISKQSNSSNSNIWGIYNATSAGVTNWFEYANLIFQTAYKFNHSADFLLRKINPVKSDEYKQAAERPKFSHLSTDKLTSTFPIISKNFEEYVFEEFKKL